MIGHCLTEYEKIGNDQYLTCSATVMFFSKTASMEVTCSKPDSSKLEEKGHTPVEIAKVAHLVYSLLNVN